MYLSRIQLDINQLTPPMLQKWQQATPYASHQWLWQLFAGQEERDFLFRQQSDQQFFVLSARPPVMQHDLFRIETKPFQPQLAEGLILDFQLRANPVICRQGKRCDVMMDAKFRAKAGDVDSQEWWALQVNAATAWLARQGEQHGFRPQKKDDWFADQEQDAVTVQSYQQHVFQRRSGEKPIHYSSVDFTGTLMVTDPARFEKALFTGIGKSRAMGCGMLMIKRSL